MLQVEDDSNSGQLLIDGQRHDYEQLAAVARQVVSSGVEQTVAVESVGATHLSEIVVRRRTRPNRVSLDEGRVVFALAPEIAHCFLSFLQFPDHVDLPEAPMRYHHHYDAFADDGMFVAPDSLSVVFGLRTDA